MPARASSDRSRLLEVGGRSFGPGTGVRLEPLDPARHGDDLFEAGSGPDAERLWRYLSERPFPDRASFDGWLTKATASEDPLFFAAGDPATGRAEGRLALMRIDAANGVIEVGHILFGPRLARTRGATEAVYLLARHVFDDLGYRRFVRRRLPPAHGRQRREPRHGLVLDARPRVAGAQAGVRALARSIEL